MTNLVRVSKRLIPVEQIAVIEPYIADPNAPLRTSKDFKSRLVLLDKDSVLSEEAPAELAKANSFRTLVKDGVFTNPMVPYWVESFQPDESFKPTKAFLSRLLWRGREGLAQSRLLLAPPETVLAVAVRGEADPDDQSATQETTAPRQQQRPPRRRRARTGDQPHA